MQSVSSSSPHGNRAIRVGVISSAPAPYRKGLFERLGRRRDIELKVFFLGRTCGVWNWDGEIGGNFDMEFLELPLYIPKDRYSLWLHPQIPRILGKDRFDVAVIGGYFIPSFLLAIYWCRRNGIPYILWSESHSGMQRSLLRRAFRSAVVGRIVRGAAAHLAVGSGAADYLASFGVDRDRIFIVLNSPDVERICRESERLGREKEEWKRQKNLGPGPVALFVGRLSPDKGLSDLLDAYASACGGMARSPNLVLVGKGELESEIRERVSREGWPNVRIEGFVQPDKVVEYYARSDFLVLPSRHEPFGAVVQEAMAAGLPVVATSAVGAAADLVKEGETGCIVPPGSPEELAKKMAALWNNGELCGEMGSKCADVAGSLGHAHGEEEFVKAVRKAAGK